MTSARHFRNPVSMAKLIMKNSRHCALSGEGALKFARKERFSGICEVNELISQRSKNMKVSEDNSDDFVDVTMRGVLVKETDDSRNMASAVAREGRGDTAMAFEEEDGGDSASAVAGNFSGSDDTSSAVANDDSGDTVSAVARDVNGHFACAMSTGMIGQNLYIIFPTENCLSYKTAQHT